MGSFIVGAYTDKGQVRAINEDSFLIINDQPIKIFAVADGMGGHKGGSVASSLAISVLDAYAHDPARLEESLFSAIKKANSEILEKSGSSLDLEGMGTTLTALCTYEGECIIAHVGDSRAYLFREGTLKRLTKDHSLVEKMVKEGQITPGEALNHPQRHILMQALGLEEDIEIDISNLELLAEDKIMLCTDGLTELIKDEELANLLAETSDLESQARRMVECANAKGGFDNITVVLINYKEDLASQ